MSWVLPSLSLSVVLTVCADPRIMLLLFVTEVGDQHFAHMRQDWITEEKQKSVFSFSLTLGELCKTCEKCAR